MSTIYTPGRDQKENDYRADLCHRAAQVSPLYAAAPDMLAVIGESLDMLAGNPSPEAIDTVRAMLAGAQARAKIVK